MLADGRGSLRTRFYETLPKNLRVPDLNDPADVLRSAEMENIAMDASMLNDYCDIWNQSSQHEAR